MVKQPNEHSDLLILGVDMCVIIPPCRIKREQSIVSIMSPRPRQALHRNLCSHCYSLGCKVLVIKHPLCIFVLLLTLAQFFHQNIGIVLEIEYVVESFLSSLCDRIMDIRIIVIYKAGHFGSKNPSLQINNAIRT